MRGRVPGMAANGDDYLRSSYDLQKGARTRHWASTGHVYVTAAPSAPPRMPERSVQRVYAQPNAQIPITHATLGTSNLIPEQAARPSNRCTFHRA